MKDIDNILGKRVCDIKFLANEFQQNNIEIEKILVNFENYKLLLEIDQEFDQIIPKIIKDYSLSKTEPDHRLFDATDVLFKEYKKLLNKKLIWLWEMTNNQGYFDGIQMEFENNITYQFLIEASYFRNSKLEKI